MNQSESFLKILSKSEKCDRPMMGNWIICKKNTPISIVFFVLFLTKSPFFGLNSEKMETVLLFFAVEEF